MITRTSRGLDAGATTRPPYFVMELVHGCRSPSSRRQRPDPHERLKLFLKVCEASSTPPEGIIHRDLKPEHPRTCTTENRAKVIDFGPPRRCNTR